MLTNQQLVDKARNAIALYRRIYDKYPQIVGIDGQRLSEMQTTQIAFPELTGPLPPFYVDDGRDPLDISLPSIRIEIVHFHPCQGGLPDEVYLPHPKHDCRVVSGAGLQRMQRMRTSRAFRSLEPLVAYGRITINDHEMEQVGFRD